MPSTKEAVITEIALVPVNYQTVVMVQYNTGEIEDLLGYFEDEMEGLLDPKSFVGKTQQEAYLIWFAADQEWLRLPSTIPSVVPTPPSEREQRLTLALETYAQLGGEAEA